jgi:1-phosphofructokinase family hexose kinase
MILNVNLNPCIDINIEVNSLSVGMTNDIISKRVFYTGKALNTAIGLSRLGASSFLTGFMYEDYGSFFEQELHKEDVNYKFVWNNGRVSVNYKFIDHKSMLTELDDVTPTVSQEKQDELVKVVSEISQNCEAVVLSGVLANGMPADYYSKVLSAVPKNVKKVVDTEGDRLIAALACGVDLVKPNIDELQRTFKKQIKSKDTLKEVCRQLISMGAKIVLVSLGKQGAVITDGEKWYYCKSINVAVNSTEGAGDAMVAAAAKALVEGADLPQILRCGVAAGTAAVTLPDSISFQKEKYNEILTSLNVKEI